MTQQVKTLCPYCGVGCGLIATTDGSRVLKVRGDPSHPANFGKVCPKGGTVAQTVNVPTRLRYAMVREQITGQPTVVPPAAAIQRVAQGLDRILQSDGPGAIAFYLSGQLTTEAQYLTGKFAKACLRTNHVDTNSRLCMASAASGMTLSLGSDGPPTCYADIELADTFFFIGSNAADCHPVTFGRVAEQMRKRGSRCIVADPRRTATAEAATLHLALRPGSDLALMNGLLRLLRDSGRLDRTFIAAHTEQWDELDRLLEDYPAPRVAAECGIGLDELMAAADILRHSARLITFWTMGVNQSLAGTFTSNAIINLHLATGQIGKPGCGPFSLTGQPNAMGGRDCGYMSHALPGHRFVADAEHRRQMETLWGLPPGTIHPQPGYDAVTMFDALDRGELRAIWIIGTNPAASMPNLKKVRRALQEAELVVVQDAYYPTETTSFAHVVLPAAVNLEQTGTFCNSERRVTLMEQVVPPPGDARPDWWWVQQIALAMGFKSRLQHESAEEIFDEFARTTAGRPNDQSALYHRMLREKGPQQWPCPALGHVQSRRYTDGIFPTPSGRARFWARTGPPPEGRSDAQFPLILTTGRTPNQWHTRTKTGTVANLNQLDPGPYVQMHPSDAQEHGVQDGQKIEVFSRQGRACGTVRIDPAIARRLLFMPIHWNELWQPRASPNEATADEIDAISKQPVLKYCAVAVRAVESAAFQRLDASGE
ncbi:MAG TPA: nitrate reductase [Tepidisphaeraceae bacterium]|nr:nitrate reductase [Tepidisphaeraceae bacterium]